MMNTEELLRFAFTQSSNQTIVGQTVFPGWAARAAGNGPDALVMPPTTAGARPGRADSSRATRLPFGTTDLLAVTPFPAYPVRVTGLTERERLDHALIAAFGLQRREPSNAYNDHRAFPSVRSKFPVHAFVTREGRHHWLDVYRHALLDMDAPARQEDQDRVLLTARYSHLPAPYGKLRGPLTELETGINLRALCVALDLFAVPYRADLPDGTSEACLRELKLDPVWEWTLPVAVRPRPGATGTTDGTGAARAAEPGAPSDDPVWREVVEANRTAMLRPADPPVPPVPSIPPAGVSGQAAGSWAEVFWARSSGTMPRELMGLAGRRQVKPFSIVRDAMAWLDVPLPSTLLRQVRQLLTVTVCLQDIEGERGGVYRMTDRGLTLIERGDALATGLEGGYGHGQMANVGCGVRFANANWFISVRARRLTGELGPWAWPLALLASGWMAQGLCLAAAAHGLYARPARAFMEIPVQRLLGLAPDELILISVTSGAPRFTESTLDLRL